MGVKSEWPFSRDVENHFNNGSVIFFTREAEGEYPIISVTENINDLLGFQPSYFTENNRGWFERIHPEDKDMVLSQFEGVIRTGDMSHYKYRFKNKEGSYVWMQEEISCFQQDENAVIYGTSVDITECRNKEKALTNRQKQYQSLVKRCKHMDIILDSLPNIYVLMDEDLQLLHWNNNAEKYSGYSSNELERHNAYDLIVSEEHSELEKALQQARKNKVQGTELKLKTKSGEAIPYFWKGYYIELNNQNYFLCVGVDITLQKETERELMDEKRFNEALVESLPGIFYMIDTDNNYIRWNKNFEYDLGYESNDIKKMIPADFFTDEEYEHVEKAIQKVFEKGRAEVEANIVTKNGQTVPYYLTGNLFRQDNEQYLLGVGYDISEQVKARKRLRKSEEMFRTLFLQAPAAIVMVSPDNKIQDVNDSFSELFGYSKEEIVGKDIDEVLVPEDEYEEAPKMPTEYFRMDSFNQEAKRIASDGSLVDVFVAAIPVFVDGEPLAGFGMYIDMTEQKKYEEEIYNSLKEKHVLLKEIHHRVKNNLAVVSGLLQLQVYETDDPIIQDTLKESESRIQTMALIHEKLYNSQNLSRISCKSYIGDLVNTIRNTISTDKDISVITEIADVELTINQAVPFALLVNEVVTNSFKHAFEGQEEGRIEIYLDSEGNQLKVRISDNGIGIPEDFDIKESDSLGLTLINNFIQQLEADWEIVNDNGTLMSLNFCIDSVNGSSSNIIEL